jgi:hypothetical protein
MASDIDLEMVVKDLRIEPRAHRNSQVLRVTGYSPSLFSYDGEGELVYEWDEESAGSDPDRWTEEFYRMVVPLAWAEPVLRMARETGSAQGVMPAEHWRIDNHVDTYSGTGGDSKSRPPFNSSWTRSLVLATLQIHDGVIAIHDASSYKYRKAPARLQDTTNAT